MTDRTIDLDQRRDMSAQKATELRRLMDDGEVNEKVNEKMNEKVNEKA